MDWITPISRVLRYIKQKTYHINGKIVLTIAIKI